MNENKIDPGEGYRLLKNGEKIRASDEVLEGYPLKWTRTMFPGNEVGWSTIHLDYRRRIQPGEVQCRYCGDWVMAVKGCLKCNEVRRDIQEMANREFGINPKDLAGAKKVAVGLLPGAGIVYGALAMQNGAAKYGPYNWRDEQIQMTAYLDAIERHLLALRDGEENDADGVPHLGSIIAGAAILADAKEGGFLIDNRPKPGPAAATLLKFQKAS